jgi:hypothetical protein
MVATHGAMAATGGFKPFPTLFNKKVCFSVFKASLEKPV